MSLTLKAGWLYFLREEDFQTGVRGPYVKIGKTDGERPVSARMDDHQTGNPRRITESHSMRTSFIDDLETHLHHRFASVRVHGEWFELDARGLKAAIDEANTINTQLEKVAAKAKRAKSLATKPSDGSTKKANAQTRRLHADYVTVERERSRLRLMRDMLEIDLRRLTADSSGIAGITLQSVTFPQPALDKTALEAARGALYRKFLIQKDGFSKRFTITDKPTSAKAHKEFNEKMKAARAKLAAVNSVKASEKKRSASASKLHGEWLELHSRIASLALIAACIEVEIQSLCGVAEEIEGVCRWKREHNISESFDGAGFKKAHPRIWAQFAVIPNPQVRLKVLDHRPY